ncbi:MAG: tetratricopeptide repeat protein [Cyanothece sp. SIO1E1]|nr:tetratricopeptide repeat protein [Cyanothece sp. SIO1E1]
MSKYSPLFSLLVLFGLWGTAQPASSQALIPYTLPLNFEQLEEQGLGLAQEAFQLAQFEQYEIALSRAQLASQLAPKNQQVWALLGSLYLQTDATEQGIKALEQADELGPDDPAILFALGSAYFSQDDYTKSAEYLKAGLAIEEIPGALFDLGNAYYKLDRFQDAIAEYEKAFEKDAAFWPAVNNIGLALYETGDTEGAIRQWRSAIEINNEEAEPQLATAVALYNTGKREQGLAMGEAALELNSSYADLDFLRENLWGDRLIAATIEFLQTPQIKATLAQLEGGVPDLTN